MDVQQLLADPQYVQQPESKQNVSLEQSRSAIQEVGKIDNASVQSMQSLLQLSVDNNHEMFLSKAMLCLDSLMNTINLQHNELVQNLYQMMPSSLQSPAIGNNNASVMSLKQPHSTTSPHLQSNSTVILNSVSGPSSKESDPSKANSSSQMTYRRLQSLPHKGVTNGGVSKHERYRRTRDVLQSSGLLTAAHKMSQLLKQSSRLDQQIATFKAIVSQHVTNMIANPVNVKTQQNNMQVLDMSNGFSTTTQHMHGDQLGASSVLQTGSDSSKQ